MHSFCQQDIFTGFKAEEVDSNDWKFTDACAMPMRASVSPAPPFWSTLNTGNSYTTASFR